MMKKGKSDRPMFSVGGLRKREERIVRGILRKTMGSGGEGPREERGHATVRNQEEVFLSKSLQEGEKD